MAFFEPRWLYYLFGQVWIWCRRKWMWAFYPFERFVFKNVLKILLINIWIFIPLLIYMWGVEGVTEEATELIENMSASDHAILRDRVHQPTKKSLLELPSQDTVLAQNKLFSKQLEILTETIGKLPTKLFTGQPSQSSVLQVTGCTICGGVHESGHCIPFEEKTQEVSYMGNQQRQGYNQRGFSGFQQGPYNQQGQ